MFEYFFCNLTFIFDVFLSRTCYKGKLIAKGRLQHDIKTVRKERGLNCRLCLEAIKCTFNFFVLSRF